MRRRVSLLLGNGHAGVAQYPLAKVYREAAVVEERLNSAAVTNAVLTQMAVASLLSKEAGKEFKKLIELIGGAGVQG